MARSDPSRTGGWREHLTLRTLRAGLAAFQGEGLKLRAMALTYISVFSLLPALMVAISVVRAFADLDRFRPRIQQFLVENLAVGARAVVSDYLERQLFAAPVRSFGILGFALLVVSAVALFSQIERAVNAIWGVRRQRPLLRRWLTYWAGLTVGPLVIVGSIALGVIAHDRLGGSSLLGRGAGWLATLALFVAAYQLLPATRVRFWPAFAAGSAAGVAFELSKDAYAWAVSHLFRFQLLYGSLTAVFVFLFWLYLAWTIFLFGARLSFVLQHHRSLVDFHDPEGKAMSRELLAARALLAVALAWWDGQGPLDPGEVADRLDAPAEPVRDVLAQLCAAGLLAEEGDGALAPARPLARTTLADVRMVIAGALPSAPPGEGGERLARLLQEAEGAAAARLGETTIEDLCQGARAGKAAPDGPLPTADGSQAEGTARIPV
jgi:membrane protein